jgi:hypothetical protein
VYSAGPRAREAGRDEPTLQRGLGKRASIPMQYSMMPHSLAQPALALRHSQQQHSGRKAVKRSHYPHPGNYPFPLNLEIPHRTCRHWTWFYRSLGLRLDAFTPSLRHPRIRYASLLSWWTIHRCSSVIAIDCRICGKSRTGRS